MEFDMEFVTRRDNRPTTVRREKTSLKTNAPPARTGRREHRTIGIRRQVISQTR
jgi:hypothetical protein